MAQALSEEEFQRMQAQLLELRTQNYQLSDGVRKNSQELLSLRQKHGALEREYAKSQKALSKSKKAQEVEALLGENEMLQGKLHSQEEDFRLQNSTLMQELSKLCCQIEQLEAENVSLKEGCTSLPTTPRAPEEELRKVASNRSIPPLREEETSSLNGHRISQGNEEKAQSVTGAREQESSGPPAEDTEDAEGFTLKSDPENLLLREELRHLQEKVSKLQEDNIKISEKLKKKHESYLRLQTDKEALYNDSRTKIEEIQQKKEEDVKSLQVKNQKLQQDLLVAQQYSADLKEQLLSLKQEHEQALHGLQEEVTWHNAESREQVESILSENDALRTNLAALEQIQTSRTQELSLLREQSSALTAELQQLQGEKDVLLVQKEDLKTQLQMTQGVIITLRHIFYTTTSVVHKKESLHANGRLADQMGQLAQDLDDARKSADKRKAMLDEMAIEMLQEKAHHKDEMGNLKLQHEKEVLSIRAKYEKELRELHDEKNRGEDLLRGQLRDEKARSRELEGLQQTLEELRLHIQSLEGTKGWFERRLKEAEETVERNELQHKEDVTKIDAKHREELDLKQEELTHIQGELEMFSKEKSDLLQRIDHLKQEVKDTADGQRILEKKGSSALKDLKRQLHLERKRADKLQERLQEILTNSKTRTGLEDLMLAEMSSPSRTQTGDSSSISSFSYREMMKENVPASSSKSSTSSPQSQPPRPAELSDEEVTDLFQRLAEIQQEKWLLEEKVKHLEVSSASMAEDLCRKSAIIETYVMDSRIDVSATHTQLDRSSIGSVLRDLVKPGDENLREMNKKLQNMLEEQLTKNMHLQKDLEALSQEIVRLSKECAAIPEKSQSPASH